MTPRAATLPLRFVDGSWDEALELTITTRQQGSPLERHMAVTIQSQLAFNQGDVDLAWSLVREMVPRGPDSQPDDALFPYAMEVLRLATRMAVEAGDAADAWKWLRAHNRWLDWSGAVRGRADAHLLQAKIHWLEGQADQAKACADEATHCASEPRQPLVLLACHRFLGELLTSLRRFADAEEHFDAAMALADACAAPYERARTLIALAELYVATNRSKHAEAALTDAHRIANELRAKPLVEQVDELAERLGSTQNNHAQLTSRETDVLRLVAEGLTDAEVADRLFISPRTVGQHLRSIYNKLGVSSRTQATRIAVQSNLI